MKIFCILEHERCEKEILPLIQTLKQQVSDLQTILLDNIGLVLNTLIPEEEKALQIIERIKEGARTVDVAYEMRNEFQESDKNIKDQQQLIRVRANRSKPFREFIGLGDDYETARRVKEKFLDPIIATLTRYPKT